MYRKMVDWLGNLPKHPRKPNRLASWIGRNWARFSYATRIEPTWLEVNRLEIPIVDLPDKFVGLRIAQLSDLHCGHGVTQNYLQQAVELTHAEAPDLIVLTGDFIHKGFHHVQEAAKIAGKLRCPLGVYAVLGNHDFSVRNALGIRRHPDLGRAVASALRHEGIRVLQNESVRLERSNQVVYLAGVDDLWSRACDPDRALNGLPADVPRIVLAHNPCTIDLVKNHRCDLMLSGHTHGGQVNLPRFGRVALGPNGRRFPAGLYAVGHCQLYVNKGVGFGLRVRFGVRPEVAVFTLTRALSDQVAI